MGIRERLIIKNFFTITEFEWDVKGFNVLTGGMASGKSLALKLLFFCEQVFQLSVFRNNFPINKDFFKEEVFFNNIEDKFNNVFFSKNHKVDFENTKIIYEYCQTLSEPSLFEKSEVKNGQLEFDVNTFDLSAEWDKGSRKLRWKSKYIVSKLDTWQKFFDEKNTPELIERVRQRVYESIKTDFSDTFPLAAMFIPASRAILAITDTFTSRDQFINRFNEMKNFALSFDDIGDISSETVNQILQLKNISIDGDKIKQPIFELTNGRSISSLELSSGQQELLYLLLVIDDLKRTDFAYGDYASIFIEEPSAHLFPREQKDTIEFLAASFNELQKNEGSDPGHRFFISTHSPYVLNTINNLLEKGRLLETGSAITNVEEKQRIIEKIEALRFPSLSIEDVSAYMIEEDGNVASMIHNENDEPYMYSEVIDKISQEITSGTGQLFDLDSEIKRALRHKE